MSADTGHWEITGITVMPPTPFIIKSVDAASGAFPTKEKWLFKDDTIGSNTIMVEEDRIGKV